MARTQESDVWLAETISREKRLGPIQKTNDTRGERFMSRLSNRFQLGALVLACGASIAMPAVADDAQTLRQLRTQLEEMQKRIAELEKNQQRTAMEKQSASKAASWKANSKALKVYGQMRASIDNHSGDWKEGSDGTSIVSNASRIGVQGALPSGLGDANLIYRAELRYETTDSVNGTAGKNVEFREGYAGLASPTWGRLRLGRLSTAYKTTLTKIDPWNDNAPQSRSGGRQGSSEFHSSYFNNAIDYVSPRILGGLTGSIWYATEFDNSAKPLHNTGTLKNFTGGSASGLGLKYKAGPLFLAADYIDIDADNITKAGLANDNGWQIGGRYKVGPFSFAALYEDVEDIGLGTNLYLNGIYKMGKTRFIAAYGTNENGAVYNNDDYTNWSFGIKYALNKKSELLAAYNSRSNDTKNTELNTLTIGINAKFGY